MKEEIRTKSKKMTDAITAERREAILAQGREEGQKAFPATSDIQTVNVMWGGILHQNICEGKTPYKSTQ